MTPEELEALRAERRLEKDREVRRAERAADFAKSQARPLPRAEAPAYPKFTPTFDIERRITEAVEQKAKEEVLKRGTTMAPGTSISEARAAQEKEAREAAEKARARTIQPGVERPVEPGILPIFRPSRIEEVPMVELAPAPVPEGAGVLLEGPALPRVQRVPAETAPRFGLYDPEALMAEQKPKVERMYRDPKTGELRPPTLTEEFIESFAQQTEISEERFRQIAEDRELQQLKIDKAIERGEDVPFFDRYLAPATFGVLTSERQGKGLVETPLGTSLRAGLSYLENAAAEGYFRGAGYEVDERGLPVDPDDYALAFKEVREKAGLPEVVYPLQLPGKVAAFVASFQPGVETKAVEDLFAAVPQLAIPLPGFATERQKVKMTKFDPEGRRVVSEEVAPDPLTSPREALDFYKRRVVENVAKGRTFADEWYDTPALREHYARTTGDPEWAYYAGMVPSLFTPAGPGVALRLAGKALSTGADVAGLSSKSKSLDALKRADAEVAAAGTALNSLQNTQRTRGFISSPAATAQRAAATKRLDDAKVRREDLLRQAEAKTSPDVVRAVASNAVKVAVPDAAKAQQFSEAIKNPANKIETPADLIALADRTGILDAEEAARVTRLTLRNTPDDYVLISDAVAVPRSQARELKPLLTGMREGLFLRNTAGLAVKLNEAAARLPAGSPIVAKLNTLADTLVRNTAAVLDPAAISQTTGLRGTYYFKNLTKATRGEIETTYKAAMRQLGEDPPRAFKELSQTTPTEAGIMAGTGFAKELGKYASWDEVPAALRRQAIDAHDAAMAIFLGRHVRKANELTRAQLYFDTAEQGMSAFKQARALDTPFMRRLMASRGVLRTETLSAARVANEIARAGQTSLRVLKQALADEVKQVGTVDKAINNLMSRELSKSGETPEAAWTALFTRMYGGDPKKPLDAAVLRAPGFNTVYPTLDAARALDTALAESKIVTGMFPPNFNNAFLAVIMENGLRKNISKNTRDTQLAEAASSGYTQYQVTGGMVKQALTDLLAEQARLLPVQGAGVQVKVPDYFNDFMGVRGHLYDTAAGEAEKALAEGVGEGLFKALDSIPTRPRGDVAAYLNDALDLTLFRMLRNITQRMSYGYVVPNLLTQGGRLLSMGIIPLTTIGARNTFKATDRAAMKAAELVGLRRLTGGGITTPDGIYYSPKVLDDLANDYGLGVSQLETERVGDLAANLMKEVNKQARAPLPGGRLSVLDELNRVPAARAVVSSFNPLDKGLFLRVAEAIELGFRKSVFEMALARGDVPSEAAELARKSQFDYSRTPDYIQQQAGQFLGESSALYQATAEALLNIVNKPQVATFVLKGLKQKAEANDPYNVHGDKALKSLGIVTAGGDNYYLPELPFLRPVEAVIGGARRVDHLAQDITDAFKLGGPFDATYAAASGGAELVVRTAGDLLAPSVVEAYDRFEEGEEYITTGVPEATPMSDEKAFWTLAMTAHLRDPEHVPGGEWQTFISYFDPVEVEPPAEYTEVIGGRKYWTRQPPEGTPHLFMGFDDNNRRLYYAFEPSNTGLRNIKIMRTVTPETLERLLPLYATMDFEKAAPGKATAPFEVYGEPLVPTSPREAAMEALLPPVEMTPEEARRQQAEAIKSVREQVKVE